MLATRWGWSSGPSIVLPIVLAFAFGYSLTVRPVLAAGVGLRRALRVALAADTVWIATMEAMDNVNRALVARGEGHAVVQELHVR